MTPSSQETEPPEHPDRFNVMAAFADELGVLFSDAALIIKDLNRFVE